MKTALICGVSGQDGPYLAQLLLGNGYRVIGTSRDAALNSFSGLGALGIRERVEVRSMVPTDLGSVMKTLSLVQPDEVYNLSGQSSVGLSFEQPMVTLESIAIGTLNLLEAIRLQKAPTRFYNACSGECFGETGPEGADETTPFAPRSPYGVAKASSYWAVANYREAYGLHASSGILFNHESPLRPRRFVTKKIVHEACQIARRREGRLELGNLEIHRDWGWAPEYVDAMWRMVQQETPGDFVVATGISSSLADFVAEVFRALDLDWKDWVTSNAALFRPTDIRYSFGRAKKAATILGWKASYKMPEVVRAMVRDEQERAPAGST